ncbi:unnamed protein product [Litomosoides sigmodontis]|uniref:Uncharacterized protein n=1 Tax=Litomosoides sigmodontis TaxID=42156 RepID=A0A3P6VGB1_LITSI|nr:unnamed protein product [Litomosoides sigmodontis]
MIVIITVIGNDSNSDSNRDIDDDDDDDDDDVDDGDDGDDVSDNPKSLEQIQQPYVWRKREEWIANGGATALLIGWMTGSEEW